MRQLIATMLVTAGFCAAASAATYRWVDDQGVVHFTDDPDRIPAKYLKGVTERGGAAPEVSSPGSTQPVSPSQQQVLPAQGGPGSTLPGGMNEQTWRSRFSALRNEIKTLQDGLPEKRKALEQLRRKRIIYQRTQERVAYNVLVEAIERDEARIAELKGQLSALEVEASRMGVPLEWRK
uniref:DUF4124 domain-containing protein n=1 Tax=Geobacter metallireducens TaxID=28232 RepID=A0A831UDX7_GEOME